MKALISKTNIKSMGSTKKLEDKLAEKISGDENLFPTSLVTRIISFSLEFFEKRCPCWIVFCLFFHGFLSIMIPCCI